MATGGCEHTSDEIFKFKCTPCSKINRQREAVKYCVECQGYCCQSCVDMHRAFAAIEGHKLLDKASFKSSTVLMTNLPSVPTEICSVHAIKILDMYCGNHDVVGCTTCMTLDHRTCADVQLITDVVDTMFNKTDEDETCLKLRVKKSAAEKIKTSKEALLEELNKTKTDAVNRIKAFRAELETILQNIEKESIKEVEKEYQTMNTKLLEEIKKSENQMNVIKQAENNMKQSDGNVAQQFVSMKTAQKIIAQAENILNAFDAYDARVSFAADQSVLEFLQKLKTFGSVSSGHLYTVKGTREMNIKLQNDTSTCSVFGSCLTPGGKLLLSDFNNQKLKLADIVKHSVVDYCDLPCNPWGVCCIDEQEAVVTLDNSTIQFVSLGDQMKPTQDIKLNHACFGIAYKDSKLLISTNGSSLFIHDMTGTLLQTISKDSSGNDLFTQCRQLAFSDFGDKIYVGDRQSNIVTLNGLGEHCSNFIDSDFVNGMGVCTDSRGNVFACAYQSKNVIQIGQSGQKVGTVVKSSHGLARPWSLVFSPQSCTLIVTEDQSDTVMVFDLQ